MIIREPVKLTIMALMVAAAALLGWWYFNPSQAPDWLRGYLPVHTAAGAVLYKWRDDDGQLHITDDPPDDRDYQEVFYSGDVNLVPGTVDSDD